MHDPWVNGIEDRPCASGARMMPLLERHGSPATYRWATITTKSGLWSQMNRGVFDEVGRQASYLPRYVKTSDGPERYPESCASNCFKIEVA